MSYEVCILPKCGLVCSILCGEINGGTVPVPQCAAYAADEDADKHGGGLGVIVRVGGGQAVLGECSSRGESGWRG
jgi:hypothetical protein